MSRRRFSGHHLEALRGRLTQTDLANGLRKRGYGTTQTTVSRWESGQQPRADVLPALAAELGCTVDELFTDEDDEESSPTVQLAADLFQRAVDAAVADALSRRRVAA